MKTRKLLAASFIILSLALGIVFYLMIDVPNNLEGYFQKSYYGQFGPITICLELLIAGYYLFKGHTKANFALALFGFTAVLDVIFNFTGMMLSTVPIYGMILFSCAAIISFWIAFSNTFDLGRITLKATLISFVLGNAVELFFNYL